MRMPFLFLFALLLASVPAAGQKVSSVEIAGESMMTFGADPDTPFANHYSLVVKDSEGNAVELPSGYSVQWDIDGFKTENDTQGQYCDSYGRFSANGAAAQHTTFELRNVPMNFIGRMTAVLHIGRKAYTASKYVAALALPLEKKGDAGTDNSQTVAIAAESGCVYTVRVAYTGVLQAGYLNEDLSGYELGRQEKPDTAEYAVPCLNGRIDLRVTADNGAVPHIAYASIVRRQPKAPSAKRKVHHIGDSTAANKGSWAFRLLQLLMEGKYDEMAALCDFCNDGAGGRNLRTYYIQGKLASVLCHLHPGDIVMIGNNGTNGMNNDFEEDLNQYINAAEAFGAKVMLNSYTPHGAVSRWANGYNPETQRFDSHRRDQYDVLARKVADMRAESDSSYIGFVEIGKYADAIFNAYVDDYARNGHASRDAAAQAIISCFTDHNHYSNGTLACDLMLDGYGNTPGIVAQIVALLKKQE